MEEDIKEEIEETKYKYVCNVCFLHWYSFKEEFNCLSCNSENIEEDKEVSY